MAVVPRVAAGATRLAPALLRERREFRRYWTGHTISLFGDAVTLLALPLTAVLTLDATPAQVGYLTAAGLVPNLLFSLHAGAWVDRRRRWRHVMIAADLGRAALLGTVPLAYLLGVLTLGQLYVVAFLAGTLCVLFDVSSATLFVAISPRERYVEANSVLYGSRALSFVSGPSVGGLLVQLLSAPGALLADAASFVVSALCLGRIAPVEPPPETERRGGIRAGGRWIVHSPVIRASLLAGATMNFFNLAFQALFVLYATRTLGIRPGTLGVVLGSGAVGSVLGTLLAGRLARRIGIGPAYILGCVLFTAPLMLVPLAGGALSLVLALLFGARFVAGLGVMVLDICIGSIMAATIPDRLRSRVMGAFMAVNYGVRPLGSVFGGVLGGMIGLRPTLWIVTAGSVLCVFWLLPSPVSRLRWVEDRAASAP
jgi:MFS family permease